MRVRGVVLVLGLVVASAPVLTQAPPPPSSRTFEVVSIKPKGGPVLANHTERPGGGFTMISGSARDVIGRAYRVLPADIEGLPDWAAADAYDFMATGEVPDATADDRAAMKQAMLADRFQLRAHHETRARNAYDLVTSRSDGRLGPGLVPHDVDCVARALAAGEARAAGRPIEAPSSAPCSIRIASNGLRGEMTMGLLASALRLVAGRVVVDQTGLAGSYRVTLEFDQSADLGVAAAPASSARPSLFAALPEQLGLRLQPSRIQVQVLVIDHIQRPAEN